MMLFLHLLTHLLLSLLAGYLVWRKYKNPAWVFSIALLAGVLIDLDHLFDYFLAFGFNFNINYFLKGYQFLVSDKIYILFHGWEYVILTLALSVILKHKLAKAILLAFSLSLFFHLTFDVIHNRIPVRSYSIVYRASQEFELEKLVSQEHYKMHMETKQQTEEIFK